MEYRLSLKTKSKLHLDPCDKIATRAREYYEKYNVKIEIYNPNAEEIQAESAECINVTELLLMALFPESDLELIVNGNQPEQTLKIIASEMANLISRNYYYSPASETLTKSSPF